MGKLETNKKKKKEALFNTAFELFTTKGLAKTTISDIVDKAGVAKGTFYLYFKDKYDIRNKLVSHKTGELFFHAHEALEKSGVTGFENQVHFIVDYILTELDQNRTLLLFISKNLAWGVFKGAFEEKMPDEDYHFYQSYLDMLSKNGKTYQNPELLLFTIIELVGASCYSCILYQQPVPLTEYRPYLHRTIDGIMKTFSEENAELQAQKVD
ncbi:MAG: TetR/AcrR family transcriptional regulator [Blautia sp.]|nr:TetR/AcrR family transcriptional regulator [Clostridia bacterium]MDY4693569.1 TetR/AcrR family transcriptional regulator [Blautia sp.]MDY5555538.1 TetR/AcrR family transcriptional regulator [Blautia sp.]